MYEKTEEIYNEMHEKGTIPKERVEATVENFNERFSNMKIEDIKSIATFDAGLISMQIMLIAK